MTGADGAQIAGSISVQLDYLGKVADYLKVPDVVSEYFTPMLGRWSDLERAATGWRAAADTADKINGDISGSLGAIDSAWRGADADAFVAYLRGIGAAGTDLTDALRTMADALSTCADNLRHVVNEMAGVLAEAAEEISRAASAPAGGEGRAKKYLRDIDTPIKQLHDSAREIVESFVQLCHGAPDSRLHDERLAMGHTMPASGLVLPSHPAAVDKQSAGPASTGHSSADPMRVSVTKYGDHDAVHVSTGHGDATLDVPVHRGDQPAISAGSSGSTGGVSTNAGQPRWPTHDADTVPGAGHHVAATTAAGPAGGHPVGGHSVDGGSTVSTAGSQASAPASGVVSGASAQPGQQHAQVAQPAIGQPVANQPSQDSSMGGMPMGMGGMGGAGGGDAERKSKNRTPVDPAEIFGKPDRTAPPIIGKD